MSERAADGPGLAAGAAVERLWLDQLEALARPVGHEVRNALNGLYVNLEVVRARAAGLGEPGASVLTFAGAAADQLDVLTALSEALLAVLRPVPEPADLAQVTRRVLALVAPIARAEGGGLELVVADDERPCLTALRGEELRLVVIAVLLEALGCRATLSCELDGSAEPSLRLRRGDGIALPEPPADVRSLAERLEVRVEGADGAWCVVFPPPAG